MSERDAGIDRYAYAMPTPEKVAAIVIGYGMDNACERWAHVSPRTLHKLYLVGRARATGTCPVLLRRGGRLTDEQRAILVEAGYALGSIRQAERGLGVHENAGRGACEERGLTYPKISSDGRSRMTSLGQRASRGEPAAAAALESQYALEREVCEVVRAALALVPEQPGAGRYTLPDPGPELAAALAGHDPVAVGMVFPTLPVPPPEPATQEAVMPTRKIPTGQALRAVYAAVPADRVPYTLVDLAERYGVTPKTVYTVLQAEGLETRGRCAGLHGPKPAGKCVLRAAAPVTPDAAVPLPHGVTMALPPSAEITVPRGAPLDVDGLALAVELARRTGLAPVEAVAFVRADRGR